MEKRYRIKHLHEYDPEDLKTTHKGKMPRGWNSEGAMDHLYGRDVTDFVKKGYYMNDNRLDIEDGWVVWKRDIIQYTLEEEIVENFKQY